MATEAAAALDAETFENGHEITDEDVPAPRRPVPAAPPARPKKDLAGRSKAAILLVSLGPERAAEVFRHMRDEEIEELSLEMAKTREVPRDDVESVLGEVAENA